MYKTRTKLLAIALIFVMMFSYLGIIGEVFASGTMTTNQANVEFDTYFKDNETKTKAAIKTIGEKNYLYITIKVNNKGYLKNIVVDLDNPNFKVEDEFTAKEVSKIEDNKIYFNQIVKGEAVELAIPIKMITSTSEKISLSQIYKENKIKFTGTYVDGDGNEKQAKKDVTVNLAWTAEKYPELNIGVSKFIPYEINGEKYLVLQMNVESYLKDNNLPVKEDKIEISIPSIDGVKPEEVKVVANTTKATNGDETGASFTSSNYNYDKDTNKVTIMVENEANAQGEVSWSKQAKDEFLVTCIYKKEITKSVPVTLEASSEISIYESSITKARRSKSSQENMKDQIGELVEVEATTTESLSKGQIYANYETTAKKETEYTENITTNVGLTKIGNTELLNKVELNLTGESYTYFKELKISKSNFDKILSEEGNIKIYNGTTLVATIDKNTQADEQTYVVDLKDLNVSALKIETSKPVVEGKLELKLTKAVKNEITLSKAQAKELTKIEEKVTMTALKDTNKVTQKTVTKEIALTEPTSQAELVMDNTNLSTIVTNKDVKITAILKTNTLDCNLYKNPTLKITLPKYIETINVKNVEVLFDTEGSKLTLKENKVVENADGTKTIEVTLEGMQTEYAIAAVAKGVNVVITTDLIVNKLTPSKQEEIKMVYTNASTQETNEVSTAVNFVAPTGVVTTTSISNYKENGETLTAISGEAKVATIETMAEARNTKFEMTVINNYNNTIDNISILGRIPAKGNKEVVTGSDLGSTIDMPLVNGIAVNSKDNNKVTIYYSENVNATKDLALSTNGWTKAPTDISKVKSYLIVFTDYTMNTGDSVNFSYEAQIPANLQHNASAYGNYGVYFNNNLEAGTIQDKASSVKVGVTTGKGPILETSISSNTTEEVSTGKFIKYTVKVKNAGEDITENVKVTVDLPQYLSIINFFEGESGQYTKDYASTQYVAEIGSIKPNEEITKSFWVVVNKLTVEDICKDESHYETYNGTKYHKSNITHSDSEYKTTASLKSVVTAKDLAKAVESKEVTNNIRKAYFNISTSTTTNGLEVLNEGDEFVYNISVKLYDANITAKNTTVKVNIPSELEYEKAEVSKFNTEKDSYDTTTDGTNFNEKNRELTINLEDVTYNDSKTIKITSKVKALNNGEYEKAINSVAKISADGIAEETSNTITDTISKEGLEVTQTASIPEGSSLSAGEKFSYKFTIKNIGGNIISNLNLTDNLPKEVEYINTTYTIAGETKTINNIDSENKTTLSISILKGETAVVTINVVAKQSDEKVKIENNATITTNTINVETNKISHIIEQTEYEKPGDITTIVRKISGQVWKDENNDGIKDESETKVENVEVLLFNNETGSLVTDKDGNILKVLTDKDGKYIFQSVAKGKYTVIFLYDNVNYSATTYRKQDVDDTKNSDAIDSQITINGEERIAGITEEIDVTDSNIYNIDLGLVSNPKFDLRLDKTVTKITVQDGKNTDVYDYKNVKVAKKDLIGKDVNNTSIIVEYKLRVTNEGAIAGYVKKIVDYMPSEMKFNSELNKDWYTSENGILYNSSLANTLINPGESKEVTLILTKKMTEENLGLYHNTAEIYEAYNDLGIQDIDSTPGNNKAGEDDISSADVLITLKTGKTITFFGLSVTIIGTIAVGAYFVKKKVLR
mgnify:FL=1